MENALLQIPNDSVKQVFDLAKVLGEQLLKKGWKVTTAESCTGGGVAYALTMVPGSSQWFEVSFVTYSDRAKNSLLGVSKDLLSQKGAVSADVVQRMAEAALEKSGAQLAVAVSGIAGPDGGTAEQPVGTVWFAFAVQNKKTHTHCVQFSGERAVVRALAVRTALEGLLRAGDMR